MREELFDAELSRRGVIFVEEVDSTNLLAKRLAREGAAHSTLVLAERQTQGRGRRGRGWASPPGRNVYMSLIVRPDNLPLQRATALIFLTALAVRRACEGAVRAAGYAKEEPLFFIKWPNDLIAGGKKISGMLLETSAGEGGALDWAVIGVGINVLGADFPPELPYAASVESASGARVRRAELVGRFLDEFGALYRAFAAEGAQAVWTPYRRACATLGARVRAELPGEIVEGVARDIAADGALILRADGGEELILHAGDVSVRGVMGYAPQRDEGG